MTIDFSCMCALLGGHCRNRKKPSLDKVCPERVTINDTSQCEIKIRLGGCDFQDTCQLPKIMKIIRDRGGV